MACIDPSAINYEPGEMEDTGGCIYVQRIGENCYAFQDVDYDLLEDKNFTLSYALDGENWVFYHDYIPNAYFSTRDKLYNSKHLHLRKHNAGPVGYFGTEGTKPFFIDLVFNLGQEGILNSINWLTEVITNAEKANQEFNTFTHITIWNSWQTTGRISLASVFATLETENVVKQKGKWEFNDFRDILVDRTVQFIQDIFNDYLLVDDTDPATIFNQNQPWYEQKLMEDSFFFVRLEYDNDSDKIVILHDVEVDMTKSYK